MAIGTRFSGLDWAERINHLKKYYPDAAILQPVVIGAGGIGSWLSILLSRIGVQPMIIDYDTIENHNLGGQLFKESQIGIGF